MHIALASRSALPLFHFGNGVGRAYLLLSAVIWKNLTRNLHQQPSHNAVSDRDFVDIAPL